MKLLVDDQLPHLLIDWLRTKGFDTIHITTLLTDAHVSDRTSCERSVLKQRLVVTSDDNFLKTYFVRQEPYKLVYLTSGNLENRQLRDLFRTNFDQLSLILETANVIELNQFALDIWY